MPAYNFKKQFVAFVEEGSKLHTIRAKRRYPAKPGQPFYGYEGLRTKKARRLVRSTITRVEDITITNKKIVVAGVELSPSERDALAYADGFRENGLAGAFALMMKFWDGRRPFQGDIIHWKPLATRAQIDAAISQLHALFKANPSWENAEIDYGICTNCARFIQKQIGGRVVGYRKEDNPEAEIGDDGHDFLLIGSFLVDVWAHEYEERRALYDLSNRGDEALVRRLYGPREKWVGVKP